MSAGSSRVSRDYALCPGAVSSSSSECGAQSELCSAPRRREAHPGELAPGLAGVCLGVCTAGQ